MHNNSGSCGNSVSPTAPYGENVSVCGSMHDIINTGDIEDSKNATEYTMYCYWRLFDRWYKTGRTKSKFWVLCSIDLIWELHIWKNFLKFLYIINNVKSSCDQHILNDKGDASNASVMTTQMGGIPHGAIKISDAYYGRICFEKVLGMHTEVNRSVIPRTQKV